MATRTLFPQQLTDTRAFDIAQAMLREDPAFSHLNLPTEEAA